MFHVTLIRCINLETVSQKVENSIRFLQLWEKLKKIEIQATHSRYRSEQIGSANPVTPRCAVLDATIVTNCLGGKMGGK